MSSLDQSRAYIRICSDGCYGTVPIWQQQQQETITT
jgi:uncharacterized protein (DUF2461 family)